MYRETAIPKKPTTRIGEKEGKAYVGIEVIMSYRLHLCSKRYNYHFIIAPINSNDDPMSIYKYGLLDHE